DHSLKIWDIRCPDAQRNFDHKAPVNDVVIHPNQGELISCDQNGSIKLWDLGESSCTHELVPEEDVPIRSVTVANDGSSLVAANNKGNCYVWKMAHTRDFTDLQPITKFAAHN
ncbi:TOR complex subunit lst8, partial [Podila minutissima]